jgi:hypothetical protein
MRRLALCAVMASLAAAGCGKSGPPAPAGDGQAEMARILDAVQAATGAQRAAETAWYGPDTLHELIDGMDRYFLDAGFVRLACADWKAPGAAGDAYVELALYDMGSPEGALDVVADSRTDRTEYLDLGNEAQKTDDGLELRAGRYYARLTARRDVAGRQDFVRRLAEALARAAPPGPSDADLVAPLPAEGMRPHSAAYTTAGFLGRDYLKGVREAAYETDGGPERRFVLEAGDDAAAEALFARWKASVTPPPAAAGANELAYDEPYVGRVTVVRDGRRLRGAIRKTAGAGPQTTAPE